MSYCFKKKRCLRIRITDIIFGATNPSQTDVLFIIGNYTNERCQIKIIHYHSLLFKEV